MDLQELSDRAEITDAITRYTLAVDEGDFDRLDTVFTPDAQIDYTESGGISDAFGVVKAWLAENLPAFSSHRLHSVAQVAFDFADKWNLKLSYWEFISPNQGFGTSKNAQAKLSYNDTGLWNNGGDSGFAVIGDGRVMDIEVVPGLGTVYYGSYERPDAERLSHDGPCGAARGVLSGASGGSDRRRRPGRRTFRRHVSRVSVRRPAAWRHGGRRRRR